jgi:hypothetical protein
MIDYRQKTLFGVNNGIMLYGININTHKRSSSLEIIYFGSQKGVKHILGNLPRSGLVHIELSSTYQNNTMIFGLFK